LNEERKQRATIEAAVNNDLQVEGGSTLDPDGESLRDSIRWIIWYLRRLIQADEVHNKSLNRRFQVSQPQLSCLLVLDEYGPMLSSALARYILVQPSTMTGIIDRLEQKGLVSRRRSDTDRRGVTIHLTDPGRALVDQAPPPLPDSIISGLKRLTPETTKKIVENLAILVSLLDEVPDEAELPTVD
jgi:DNA-binding MarR family transcriptional regulator